MHKLLSIMKDFVDTGECGCNHCIHPTLLSLEEEVKLVTDPEIRAKYEEGINLIKELMKKNVELEDLDTYLEKNPDKSEEDFFKLVDETLESAKKPIKNFLAEIQK